MTTSSLRRSALLPQAMSRALLLKCMREGGAGRENSQLRGLGPLVLARSDGLLRSGSAGEGDLGR